MCDIFPEFFNSIDGEERQYLVKFKGLPDSQNNYEKKADLEKLEGGRELLAQYLKENKLEEPPAVKAKTFKRPGFPGFQISKNQTQHSTPRQSAATAAATTQAIPARITNRRKTIIGDNGRPAIPQGISQRRETTSLSSVDPACIHESVLSQPAPVTMKRLMNRHWSLTSNQQSPAKIKLRKLNQRLQTMMLI